MSVTEQSFGDLEFQLAALEALSTIVPEVGLPAYTALVAQAEQTIGIDVEAVAALAQCANLIITTLGLPYEVLEPYANYATLGYDGRVRLGVLIDLIVKNIGAN